MKEIYNRAYGVKKVSTWNDVGIGLFWVLLLSMGIWCVLGLQQ